MLRAPPRRVEGVRRGVDMRGGSAGTGIACGDSKYPVDLGKNRMLFKAREHEKMAYAVQALLDGIRCGKFARSHESDWLSSVKILIPHPRRASYDTPA